VSKLVDGDVLAPVPVVAVTEGILFCGGAKRHSNSCSETSRSLVPVARVQEGVLRQVGGQLGWVPFQTDILALLVGSLALSTKLDIMSIRNVTFDLIMDGHLKTLP